MAVPPASKSDLPRVGLEAPVKLVIAIKLGMAQWGNLAWMAISPEDICGVH